jgi:hypothetical protein
VPSVVSVFSRAAAIALARFTNASFQQATAGEARMFSKEISSKLPLIFNRTFCHLPGKAFLNSGY